MVNPILSVFPQALLSRTPLGISASNFDVCDISASLADRWASGSQASSRPLGTQGKQTKETAR